MKNSNDNTFDPGLLLSGEESKPRNLFENSNPEERVLSRDEQSKVSDQQPIRILKENSQKEVVIAKKEEPFRKQMDSQNPLFDTRKFTGINRSFRGDRKAVQENLDMGNNLVFERLLNNVKFRNNFLQTDSETLKCLKFKDSFYLGQTINHSANGQGVLFFSDMHMYTGGFRNNRFHGQGIFSFPFKGFLFAEFWEGKVNGDVFWVSERMNFSKGNLADKSEGMKFVSANAKGISNVNFEHAFGSKMVNKLKNKIGRKDLGLLDKNHETESKGPRDNEEDYDNVGELPGASKYEISAKPKHGSTVEFSEKKFHKKKFVQNVKNPKNVMKYLKTMCLMSKEFYPEKDKHDKTSKFTSEIDRFRNTLQNLENVNNFEKNHYYMKNKILESAHFNGHSDIGTVFLPWGSFCKGIFLNKTGRYFGRVQYMNGDFEWGFFRENFFHLDPRLPKTGGVDRSNPENITLETNHKHQYHVMLDGFGSRFYREKGIMITGFFRSDQLDGNYLLDFVDKESFKFSRFEKNEVKKDYFFCEKEFDYPRMYSHLNVYLMNEVSSEFMTRESKMKSSIFEGKLQKMQQTSTLRGISKKSKAKRTLEFKEMQVIKYFMDRFMDADLEKGSINSRNEMESYAKMQSTLHKDLCKKNVAEEPKKNLSLIKTPKSKPIDKKNFLDNIQNEIQINPKTLVTLNNEIGTPSHLDNSKKGSARSYAKDSIKSFKRGDLMSNQKDSEGSAQDIKIIPMVVSPSTARQEPSPSTERTPKIMSQDVSDIYRVIHSDFQYKISKKPSGNQSKKEVVDVPPQITIETNNLEKNKQEYMRKVGTKISKNKFENDLRNLDFTKDLDRDTDMKKMKEHVKKLQEIRLEKEMSGVDSAKETPKGSQKQLQEVEKRIEPLVKVDNIKINLDTLGAEPLNSNSNTRPLSMENDFIPELLNDSASNKAKNLLNNPPPVISKNISSLNDPSKKVSQNNFTNDFSIKSNTEYEKRNNGSYYDQSTEKPLEGEFNESSLNNDNRRWEDEKSEDKTEKARKIAQAKGIHFTEDSQRKALYTYGATSSRKNNASDNSEFSISSKRKQSIRGKMVHQKNKVTKINLRRNISSIAQSRNQREIDKEKMKKHIESERRKKIMEKQLEEDKMNLLLNKDRKSSPAKSNTISKPPNASYLISGSPQTSIALVDQNEGSSEQKRPESERSLPISRGNQNGKKYMVKEEPANIKKFQESVKNKGVMNQNTFGEFDDSVKLDNFDSMEVDRVEYLKHQHKKENEKNKAKERKVEQEIEAIRKRKDNKSNHLGQKKVSLAKRTPLHKKQMMKSLSKNFTKKKTEGVEDHVDDIENMGTNELLEYYDKEYKLDSNNQPNQQDDSEINDQTMNTMDMLTTSPVQHSLSKVNSKKISKDDQAPVTQTLKPAEVDADETFTHVNTTNIIHREIHDPEMKRERENQEEKEKMGFNDSTPKPLTMDLFSKTQDGIKRDLSSDNLENTQNKMKKHLISEPNSGKNIDPSPRSKKGRNQIPATRRVAPGSGHELPVPVKKSLKEPLAIGKTPPKKSIEIKSGKQYEIPTPSLQSTISRSNAEGMESDIRVDASEPQEIDYSGAQDIPMTSKVHDSPPSQQGEDAVVKNYDILRYPDQSGVQTEMEMESNAFESEKKPDPFTNTLDSRARQMIKNGEFEDDPPVDSRNEFGTNFSNSKVTGDQGLSDFENRISENNRNKFLLSDMGDTRNKQQSDNVGPVQDESVDLQSQHQRNEEEEVDRKAGAIEGNQFESPSDDDDDVFLLNPTKSPNIRKMRKSKKNRKPAKNPKSANKMKAKTTKNPFHNSEEEEQSFSKPMEMDQNQDQVRPPRKNSPKLDVSGDFQMTAMTTPNIKKKKSKRKKSKKRKPKTSANVSKPVEQPRKAYNLLENKLHNPQFTTLGNVNKKKATPKHRTAPIRNTNTNYPTPNYATVKKSTQNPPNYPQKNQPFENNYRMPTGIVQEPQELFGIGNGRFTLGNQMERMHQPRGVYETRGEPNQVLKHPSEQRSLSKKSSKQSLAKKRDNFKKLLRKSSKRLRKEIKDNHSRKDEKSRSPGRTRGGAQMFKMNESLDHENQMNKYSIKGINRERLKQEIFLKNSILNQEIPEINVQLRKDLEDYEVYAVKRTLQSKASSKKNRKSSKRGKKDRLKQLEKEIADLTKNVEKQVVDNEVFKAKVTKKYEDDED